MTSASVPDIFIVLESRDTPDSRDIPSPAERGRPDLGDQLDRSEDEGMRRIDRMHPASDRPGALAGRGCVRDSMRPSPAAPARLAPSTVNVACQTRSTRRGFAGYS